MTTIDLSFPLEGERVPRDHGYALYAALCRIAPDLHTAAWLGVHPIGGTPVDESTLSLGPRGHLRLRLPVERVVDVLPLVGAKLNIDGAPLSLGAPQVHQLEPAASLDSRMVAIKLTGAPHREHPELGRQTLDVAGFAERYTQEVKRQLAALGIEKPFELCGRRSVRVGGRRVVGYSVRVGGLSAEESLLLQEKGIGGKRRMGCGLFRATKGA